MKFSLEWLKQFLETDAGVAEVAAKLNEIEEQIGQLHGRAFLELSTGRSSDAQAAKANTQRLAAVYKKMLAGLKGKAFVSPKLK